MTDKTTDVSTDNEANYNDLTPEQANEFIEKGTLDGQSVEDTKPEVKEEKKVEKEIEETKEVEEEKQVEKTVPLKALHEERARRKEEQKSRQAMEETFKKVLEKLNPKTQEPEIDFEQDPLAYLKVKQDKIDQTQEQILKQNEEARKINETVNRYRADAAEFSKQQPDFSDAYAFLAESKYAEYKAMGYSHEEAGQLLKDEEIRIVNKAFSDEVNPAEIVYNLAKTRGFKKPVAAAVEQKQAPQVDKIEMIQKGMKASASANNAGGKVNNSLTLEELTKMSGEDFDKAFNEHFGIKNKNRKGFGF